MTPADIWEGIALALGVVAVLGWARAWFIHRHRQELSTRCAEMHSAHDAMFEKFAAERAAHRDTRDLLAATTIERDQYEKYASEARGRIAGLEQGLRANTDQLSRVGQQWREQLNINHQANRSAEVLALATNRALDRREAETFAGAHLTDLRNALRANPRMTKAQIREHLEAVTR